MGHFGIGAVGPGEDWRHKSCGVQACGGLQGLGVLGFEVSGFLLKPKP